LAIVHSKETQSGFFEISKWSEQQAQIATLRERDMHERGNWELVPGEQLHPDSEF
jgi:hypothetical protein